MAKRKTQFTVMLIAAAVVLVIDQLTKLWVASSMERGGMVSVIDGVARLRYTQNTGAAFGMFQDATGILSILSLLVIIGILITFVRVGHPGSLSVLAAGLVVGGAVGNLVDRVRLGYVVDFFEVYGPHIEINHTIYTFPVFNVADSGITVGVILILIGLIFGDTEVQGSKEASPGGDADNTDQIVQAARTGDRPALGRDESGQATGQPAVRSTTGTPGMGTGRTLREPTPAGWAGAVLVMLGFLIMALRSAGKSEGR